MCCNFCDLFGCKPHCNSACQSSVSGADCRRCCCNRNGVLGGILAGTNCCCRCRCCCCDRDCDCDQGRDRDRDCDRRDRCD